MDEVNSYEARKVVTAGGLESYHVGTPILDSTAQHVDITRCYWQLKVGTPALEDGDAAAFECTLVGTGSDSPTLSGPRSNSECMRRVRTTSTKANRDGGYRARSSVNQESGRWVWLFARETQWAARAGPLGRGTIYQALE